MPFYKITIYTKWKRYQGIRYHHEEDIDIFYFKVCDHVEHKIRGIKRVNVIMLCRQSDEVQALFRKTQWKILRL